MYEKKMDRLSGRGGDACKFMPARIKRGCGGRRENGRTDDLLLCWGNRQ